MEQGVDLLGEIRRVGKCVGVLYVLWLGLQPIIHMGKSLRHLRIFLQVTIFQRRNNTTI